MSDARTIGAATSSSASDSVAALANPMPAEPATGSSRWAYLAALTPVIFGTTYLLTSEFLPPGRPLLAATVRSLPSRAGSAPRGASAADGVVAVVRPVVGALLLGTVPAVVRRRLPAARRSRGGVAAVINSLTPLLVVVVSVRLLGTRIRTLQVVAGLLGVGGVALLVLRSSARLDPSGLLAMTGCVLMMGLATVLSKRWGHPPGMEAPAFTGWTFLLGGLTLLPFTVALEGLPTTLTGRQAVGLVYLVAISGVVAYGLWFWGLQRLAASSVTFLSLLNPVVAAVLGWLVLDQRLNAAQLLGAAVVLASVVLGQERAARPRRPRARRS